MTGRHAAAWLLAATLVGGCAGVPPAAPPGAGDLVAYEQRAAALSSWVGWDFVGRLSLDDGERGGSGTLAWQDRPDSSQLDFRGSLGRGAWRLTVEPGQATLERADGTRSAADSADELVVREVGWQVPVESLRYWVLGLQAPGPAERRAIDQRGRLIRLEQQGWAIDFDRYQPFGGVDLPGRIEAVRGAYRVKLVVARWARRDGGDRA